METSLGVLCIYIITRLVYTVSGGSLYMNRQITLTEEINARLRDEKNASALIQSLLEDHYNGTNEAHKALWQERERLKGQLTRLVSNVQAFTLSNNRLASAVEDLAAAAKEHQGYRG